MCVKSFLLDIPCPMLWTGICLLKGSWWLESIPTCRLLQGGLMPGLWSSFLEGFACLVNMVYSIILCLTIYSCVPAGTLAKWAAMHQKNGCSRPAILRGPSLWDRARPPQVSCLHALQCFFSFCENVKDFIFKRIKPF